MQLEQWHFSLFWGSSSSLIACFGIGSFLSFCEIGAAQTKWVTPALPRCLSLLLQRQEACAMCPLGWGWWKQGWRCPFHCDDDWALAKCSEKLWSPHCWRYSKPTWTWLCVGDPALSRWLDEMICKGLFQPWMILWYEHASWLILAECSVTPLPSGQFLGSVWGNTPCSQGLPSQGWHLSFPFTANKLNPAIYFIVIMPSRQKFTGRFHWVAAFPFPSQADGPGSPRFTAASGPWVAKICLLTSICY